MVAVKDRPNQGHAQKKQIPYRRVPWSWPKFLCRALPTAGRGSALLPTTPSSVRQGRICCPPGGMKCFRRFSHVKFAPFNSKTIG